MEDKWELTREDIKGELYPVLNKENWFVDNNDRVYLKKEEIYYYIANMIQENKDWYRKLQGKL